MYIELVTFVTGKKMTDYEIAQSNIIDALDPDKAKYTHCGTYHLKKEIKTNICPNFWQEFKSKQTGDIAIKLTAKEVQHFVSQILERVE